MVSAFGTAEPLTAAGLALPVRYRLRQSFRYDYDGPVTDLLHQLVVVPPLEHGDQRLRLGAVLVSDPAAQVCWFTDMDGNRRCVVQVADVPALLEFEVSVVVDRHVEATRPLPLQVLRDPRWLRHSALTRADAAIRRIAAEHGGGPRLAAADRLCALVHDRIAYGFGSTDVGTTAVQALRGGVGVCQDHAHAMLALCRAAGIACRYVSGHLVGQGGTHAWVEVLVRDGGAARAVAYDPCHGRRAHDGYVTVAVGRDYRDVPPTSGWYAGGARGHLTATRSLTAEPIGSPLLLSA